MTTVVAPKAQAPDIASQITHAMRSMGASPIPRNYHLFYEAYIGTNPTLTRDLALLGSRTTQEELDELAAVHLGTNQSNVVENAHDQLLGQLDALLKILQQEQSSLQIYNRLLDETASQINSKNHASAEILRSAIALLAKATGETLASGERTVEGVALKSQEMEQVRRELDDYKRIANTDSLTRLSNRRAFDEKLSSLYDDPMRLPVTALVLADIDNFKKINDTWGHPVGDKVLASVAAVIRSHVRRDVFIARTGGEEFALIVEGNTPDEVMSMCERIRRALETRPFRNTRTGVDYGPVTLSLGYAMASQADDPGDLYAKSDTALYGAKNAGRNRSVPFEEGMRKDYVGKGWLIYKR
ncbi:GGDEF domain-containing protein [Rhizobium sp. SSA_523]|uniref:GGDEF domain-containing protein n=1 Tax=Rhizobium sp. SSA_523 TaxID=2952477 RepID=UPI0020915AFE|nr:GGDEF domain-containing protein [Rhizobium sp. SSA_523]MCO5730015.1 GGDEF domain-containing protein [Rhizobium sp. SSA_523]WKC25086.1 GGDEF domain-containing protein [Rhizobium sp. SSA_523]